MGDFEFVDEHNNNEDEKNLLNSPGKKLKVDELEKAEYIDSNYWKLPGQLNNFSLDDLWSMFFFDRIKILVQLIKIWFDYIYFY